MRMQGPPQPKQPLGLRPPTHFSLVKRFGRMQSRRILHSRWADAGEIQASLRRKIPQTKMDGTKWKGLSALKD